MGFKLAICIGILSFCLHFAIALSLFHRGALEPIDLFFDADSGWYLKGFEKGVGAPASFGGHGFVHPNIFNVIHPPIGFLSTVAQTLGGEEFGKNVNYLLAIAISPLAAAIATSFLFLTLRTVGMNLMASLLSVLLSTVAFSGLLMGSIPESYSLVNAAFSFMFYLVSRMNNEEEMSPFLWIIAGSIILSITVTNIVPFVLVLGTALYRQGKALKEIIRPVTDTVFKSILLTGILFIVLTGFNGSFHELGRHIGQFEDLRGPSLDYTSRITQGFMNTLLPAQIHSLTPSVKDDKEHKLRVVRITFRTDLDEFLKAGLKLNHTSKSFLPRFIDMALLLSLGLTALFSLKSLSGVVSQTLLVTALVVCVYNWSFHLIFGREMFLYSQHWYFAEILVLTLPMLNRNPLGAFAKGGVALLALLATIHSVESFTYLYSVL